MKGVNGGTVHIVIAFGHFVFSVFCLFFYLFL